MSKKENQNIYQIEEIQNTNDYFLKIKFHLLEKEWGYSDFEKDFNVNHKFIVIECELKERHPRIEKLRVYLDPEREHQLNLSVYNKTIGQIFDTKGEKKDEEGRVNLLLNLYYDFEPGIKDPILLF